MEHVSVLSQKSTHILHKIVAIKQAFYFVLYSTSNRVVLVVVVLVKDEFDGWQLRRHKNIFLKQSFYEKVV